MDELPQVGRAARAWANDLENIPLFFVLGGLCVVAGTASVATGVLFGVFYPGAGGTHAHVPDGVPALAHAGLWGGRGVSDRVGRDARVENDMKGTGVLKR